MYCYEYTQYIFDQLTTDLNEYCIYINEKNTQLNNVIKIIDKKLENNIKDCLGDEYQLRKYGSRVTNTCLPWSDIDFVIVSPYNDDVHSTLFSLSNYLKENSKWNVKYIGETQVPIIKIKTTEEFHNLNLDISFEASSHHGQQCVEYINSKIKEFSPLIHLILALKTIFYNANINEPYKGGLSSYGIILLIIYFLQMKKNQGETISLDTIGKLFFELLLFYEEKKNINKPLFISNNYFLSPFAEITYTDSLTIVDPLDNYNNVAKNARDLNKILYTFHVAKESLFESCECGCHYQHDYSITENRCDHNLLNRIFNATKKVKDFNFNFNA